MNTDAGLMVNVLSGIQFSGFHHQLPVGMLCKLLNTRATQSVAQEGEERAIVGYSG
jgi:hypothetical protein